jgi:phage-related minor tail protein
VALTVGELAAILEVDATRFDAGLDRAEGSMMRMERVAKVSLADIEGAFRDLAQEAGQQGERAGEGFAEGLDDASGSGGPDAVGGMLDGLKGGAVAGLALAAGAALGAALMEGFTEALDAEAANDKLAAQLGLTEAESERAGQVAGNLFSNAYADSVDDANEALRGVMHNIHGLGDVSDAEMERITGKVLSLSTTFDADLGETTRAVGKLMKTGLAADADEALDILTRGFQSGADEAGDLLETVSEYSTQFRSMGLSGAQAMGLISQGLQAGARDADVVADAIKEFSIEAVKGGDNVRKGLGRLGLDADDLIAKFGRGGPAAAAAFDTVLDKLRGIEDPVRRNNIAFDLLGTKSEDLAEALYTLDPSEAVKALGGVEGAADRLDKTLHDNAANTLKTWKNTAKQTFVDFFGGQVLPAVEDTVGGIRDAVSGWVADNQDTLGEWSEGWSEIAGEVSAIVEEVLAFVADLWEEHGEEITRFLSETFTNLMTVIGGLLRVIRGIVQVVLGLIRGDWREMWEGIKNIFGGVWEVILGIVRQAVNAVKAWLKFSGLGEAVSRAWDSVVRWIDNAWDRISSAVVGGVNRVIATAKRLPGRVMAAVGNLGKLLYNEGRDLIQGFINGIQAMAGRLVAAIKKFVLDNIPAPVKKALGMASPSKVFADIGGNVVAGLVDGIDGSRGLVDAAMGRLADTVSVPMEGQYSVTGRMGQSAQPGLLAGAGGIQVAGPLIGEVKTYSGERFDLGQVQEDIAFRTGF